MSVSALAKLEREVAACRLCPRLVAHRENVSERKVKRYASHTYWGRAVPSFGDKSARCLIVGLAPAAHGANRTGRMFTGDRSGEWLYAALHRFGFANHANSESRADGLQLDDAYVTAIAHCAPPDNKPTKQEITNCRAYLCRELDALPRLRVVLALGRIAFDGFLASWKDAGRAPPNPKPKFAHGTCSELTPRISLLCSYHPSQQNTFTGRLTQPMFHRVFRDMRRLAEKQ